MRVRNPDQLSDIRGHRWRPSLSLVRAKCCRDIVTACPLCASLLCMKTKKLTDVLERVEAWPAELQDELAELALEIDASAAGREYRPSDQELAGIDRGLRAANEGRFPSEDDVEAAFAKFRPR